MSANIKHKEDIEFPYRISTITAIAKLNSLVNLENLYFIIKEDEDKKIYYNNNGKKEYIDLISFIEYGKTKNVSNSKGFNPKTKKITYKKKLKNSKRFDNQLTLILNLDDNFINMKLFKNGRIQMTGLKNIKNGEIVIQKMIDIIINLNFNNNIIEKNDLTFENYKICLINSDFKFLQKLISLPSIF